MCLLHPWVDIILGAFLFHVKEKRWELLPDMRRQKGAETVKLSFPPSACLSSKRRNTKKKPGKKRKKKDFNEKNKERGGETQKMGAKNERRNWEKKKKEMALEKKRERNGERENVIKMKKELRRSDSPGISAPEYEEK